MFGQRHHLLPLSSPPSKAMFIVLQVLSRLSCHGRKHSQTIFTIEILIKILAASTCMIDFFCKSMAASKFCDERKSALRRRQSESTKENLLTGLSDLSSIENALPVVTNTSSIESFPKAAALLQRDKLSFSIINWSSIFTPSSSSAIMAAILKG